MSSSHTVPWAGVSPSTLAIDLAAFDVLVVLAVFELVLKYDQEVISAPYSNAYCGYIVTPQEYKVQCYEAGHCVFGKWTLPAFQTVLKELAVELLKDKQSRNITDVTPPKFSQQELSARSFK